MTTGPQSRRCFIISAYGEEGAGDGSDRRFAWERSNKVVDEIVAPAVEQWNADRPPGARPLAHHRGDHSAETRLIMEEIYQAICHDDLLVAVLLVPNENVAYEIGLAHAMGRPVILLAHEAYPRPFDLQGRQMLIFDDRAFEPGTHRDKTIAALAERIRTHLPKTARDFTPSLLGGDAAPMTRCIAHDRFRIPYPLWNRHFWAAEQEIWLAGVSLKQLFLQAQAFTRPAVGGDRAPAAHGGWEPCGLLEVLGAQWLNGRDVAVLIMDEANPALPGVVLRPNEQPDDLETARSEIAQVTKLFQRRLPGLAADAKAAAARPGRLRFTKVRNGLIANRVSMNEHQAYITPIFLTVPVNTGPCFEAAPKSAREMKSPSDPFDEIALFKAVRDDLAFLQRINPTLTLTPDGELIDELTPSGTDDHRAG